MVVQPSRLWFPALVLVVAATPALAEIGEGNWEVGFTMGATKFDSEVADRTGFYLDVRGGYFLTDLFQIEGQLSDSDAEESAVDVALTSLFANFVFNFRAGERTVPYVLVGLGSSTLEYDGPGFNVDDDATAFQGAVGTRFFVHRGGRMAVRFELGAISEDTFDERSTHLNLAAGLTWRLGAKR